MADFIDDLMGFDPQKLEVFQEKGPKVDPNIYKTNPKDSKSEDGNYRSVVKILLNPMSPKDSIVPQAQYWLKSMDGSMPVRSSLSVGDKMCPIFRAWKRLWFSGDEEKKSLSKQIFQKNESQWVLVQILEDENKPELVGQFRVMKLAKDTYDKLMALMNPSSGSKTKPYPVMDYVVGLALNLDVKPGPDDPSQPERKQREISYSLCNFGDYAPIIKTDGTPLLTDAELELIDAYVTAAKDAESGKTEAKKKAGAKALAELRPQLRPIYEKAIAYVKDNLKDVVTSQPMDLSKYCGYQPWDEHTTEFVNKWIEIVDGGMNPETISYDQFKKMQAAAETASAPAATPTVETKTDDNNEGDLPF